MAKVLVTADDTFGFWREQTNNLTNLVGDVSYKKANSAAVFTDHEFLANHVSVSGVSFVAAASGTNPLVTTDVANGYKLRVGMNVAAYVGLTLISDPLCVISDISYAAGSVSVTFSPALTFSPTPATLTIDFTATTASYINELELGKLDRHGDTVMGVLKINHKDAAGTVGVLGTDETNFNLLNDTATTVNIGGAATSILVGAATGTTTFAHDVSINGGDLVTNQASFNLLNTTPSQITFGDAATTLTIGATTGTATLRNANVVLDGDLQVKGGDITTNQASFNLLNTTPSQITFGDAATTLTMGDETGTATIRNATVIAGTAVTGNTLKIAGTASGTTNLTSDVTTGILNVFADTTSGTINVGSASTNTVVTRIYGSGSASGNLGLYSTTNATKGLINIGTDAAQTVNINTGAGVTNFDGTTANTLGTLNGAVVIDGGASVANNLTVGLDVRVTGGDLTFGTNSTIRNATVTNTAGIYDNNTSGVITIGNNTTGTTITARTETVNLGYTVATGVVNVESTKANTLGTLDGALVVDGGASVANNLTVGADLRVTGGDITLGNTAVTIQATTETAPVSLFTTTGTITPTAISVGGGETTTTFNGNVIVATAKSLTANGPATLNGNVILGSDSADTLTVNAVTTYAVGANSTFSANATFNAAADFNGSVNIDGSNVNTVISPTGSGTVTISPVGALTINPTAVSTINNTSIGATTAQSGRFTTVVTTTATEAGAGVGSIVSAGGIASNLDVYVGGNDITGPNTGNVTVFNQTTGNVALGGASGQVTIGTEAGKIIVGDIDLNGGTITSNDASIGLFSTNATQTGVDLAIGLTNVGAKTINIGTGATGGALTANVTSALSLSGATSTFNHSANAITLVGNAGSTTLNLFNTISTTVNFAGAGTAITIGATTGSTTIRNSISQTGTGTFSTASGAISLNGNTTVTGSGTFSSGTGAVALNGAIALNAATTVADTMSMTFAGTTGNFDMSARTSGTFITGGGAVTLGGNTTISGSRTFTTGTGAVALNGPVTVAASTAFTVGTGTATFNGIADFNGAVTIDGANVNTTIAPTGTGTVTINPTGVLTLKTGNATSAASAAVSISTGTTTTSGNTGAITISSGNSVAVSGNVTITSGTGTTSGDVIIDAGNGSSIDGNIDIGTSNAVTIDIGRTSGVTTKINGLTITGSSGVLTINNGKTLTLNTNSMTLTATTGDRTINTASNITVSGATTNGRTLTFATGDADRTVTLANNLTTSGNFPITLTATASSSVTLPTTGTLATVTGSETLTNKTLTAPVINNGSLNGTTIGSTTASTAEFTNVALNTSTTLTLGEIKVFEKVNSVSPTPVIVFTLDKTVYRSAEVIIQATQGGVFSLTKLLMMHDGTDPYETEFGSIGTPPGTFDSEISGNNWNLNVTQTTATEATYKVFVTAIVL